MTVTLSLSLKRNLEKLLLTDTDVHALDKLKFAALHRRMHYAHNSAATDLDVNTLHYALSHVADAEPDTKQGNNKQSARTSQHKIPEDGNLVLHNGGHDIQGILCRIERSFRAKNHSFTLKFLEPATSNQ